MLELSLAIPLWVGKLSTGDDHEHCRRNSKFCMMAILFPGLLAY